MNKEQQTTEGSQAQQPETMPEEGKENMDANTIDICGKEATFEAEIANMDRINSTINARLFTQIEQHAMRECMGMRTYLTTCNVPQDAIEDVLADYIDILQDNYDGLHLGYGGFASIIQHCRLDELMQTADRIFEGLLLEYSSIRNVIEAILNREPNLQPDKLPKQMLFSMVSEYVEQWAHPFAAAVTENEVLRYYGQPSAIQQEKALIYRHIHCLTNLREIFITSDEDLLPIIPCHCSSNLAGILKESNESILHTAETKMQQKESKLQKKAGCKGRRGRPKKQQEEEQTDVTNESRRTPDNTAGEQPECTEAQTPAILTEKEKWTYIHANAIKALTGEILTAAAGNNGKPLNAQPLMQIIQDECNSGNTQITLTPVKQVMAQICTLPTCAPVAEETEDYVYYKFTLGQGIEWGTGNKAPNAQILRAWFLGYTFFSTHYVSLVELRAPIKRRKDGRLKYDEKGRIKTEGVFKPFTIMTQIVRATFMQEGKVIDMADMAKSTTEVKLGVHKAIISGRRQEFLTDSSGEQLIKRAKRIWFTQQQIHDFTNPAEIAFFALLHHARRKAELKTWNERSKEDILAEVFDYRTKLKLKTATALLNAERRKVREELTETQKQVNVYGEMLKGKGMAPAEVLAQQEMQDMLQNITKLTTLTENTHGLFVRAFHAEVKQDSQTWQELQKLTAEADTWDANRMQAMHLLTDYMHSKTLEDIRKHKSRDRQQLQDMFAKAKANGTLIDYKRKQAKNGIDWVWEWEIPHREDMPQDAEDVEVLEVTEVQPAADV